MLKLGSVAGVACTSHEQRDISSLPSSICVELIEHKEYIGRHGDDMPEIIGWKWGQESVSGGVRSTEGDNA